jgi:hypothetical protein
MTMRKGVSAPRFLAFLLVSAVLLASQASGQGIFTLRLKVQDGGGGVDSLLRYGRAPGATYCIDPVQFFDGTEGFIEYELPPAPPGGVFDARWFNHRPGLGGCTTASERGNGMRFDIRGYTDPSQIDTFQIKFQVGTAGPITLFWQTGLNVFSDSMRIQDAFGGFLVNVNMFTAQTVVVSNPAISVLNIFMHRAPGVVLLAPGNGSTVPTSVDLSWTPVPNATKYRVQVATDSSFSTGSLFVHDSTVTGSSLTVPGLAGPATYYWRVSAGSGSGWGGYSIRRFFRTGAVPSAPTNLAPPDGSIDQPATIQFQWTSSINATAYHLQIASDSNFTTGFAYNDSTIADTSVTVPGLASGTAFFWRVAARNDIGSSAFSSHWGFTTQLQPPSAPTLSSPANGQSGVVVSPTLSWSVGGGGGGLTFRLQVATDASFVNQIVDDTTVTTLSRQIGPLQNNTQYFWKITARNLAGWGPVSVAWNFTTVVAAPPAPGLVSPPDGAQNIPLVTTLTWNAAATAGSYRLQVARDAAFTLIVLDDSSLTATSRQVGPLLANAAHYWHVRAKNAGGSGPYSVSFMFTSTAAPPVPVLSAPPDSATRLGRSVAFSWGSSPGATAYHLQVGTDASFSTLVYNDSTITDTTRVAGLFPYGARLLWRMRALNLAGISAFSSPRTFTVMLQPPGVPTLVSPANNALNQPVVSVLRWNGAFLAAGYRVDVALDTLMTNPVAVDTSVADTVKAMRLAPSTAYYWRVTGKNTEGTYGGPSLVRRFTTGNFPPAIPVPYLPANGDTNASRTPTLWWLLSPGAYAYRAQVARDNLFQQIVADDSLLTMNAFAPGLLDPYTTYYWRARARGTAGWSAYSLIQRFTTGTLIVEVGDDPDPRRPIPDAFVLSQNYPNPFNPSTTLAFFIPVEAWVTLKVYSVLGEEVATLMSEYRTPGDHTVVWNAQDGNGQPVPSGVYLVRMTAAGGEGKAFTATRKLVLLR